MLKLTKSDGHQTEAVHTQNCQQRSYWNILNLHRKNTILKMLPINYLLMCKPWFKEIKWKKCVCKLMLPYIDNVMLYKLVAEFWRWTLMYILADISLSQTLIDEGGGWSHSLYRHYDWVLWPHGMSSWPVHDSKWPRDLIGLISGVN